MDYNATTPLEPEVVQAITAAMQEAWGNPSSPYPAGNSRSKVHRWDVLGAIAHHMGLLAFG